MMLWYKVWLESRVRFLVGVLAAAAIAILYVRLHPVLIPGWIVASHEPQTPKPVWLPLGIADYRFYVWHFLFDFHLQWVWALFAVLLSFGGLGREQAQGTALYSLGLPVTRGRWLLTRATVAFLETVLLGLITAFVVPIASWTIGQAYPLEQGIGHALLLAGGGALFVGFAILVSTVVKGDWAPLAATLGVLGLPYLVLQEYVRHANADSWVRHFDVAHVMAGPWYLTWSSVPWGSVGLIWLATIGLLALAVWCGNRLDY
jgi:ABC-type transport system involved in multi-copper enzyme maturation permease subunit